MKQICMYVCPSVRDARTKFHSREWGSVLLMDGRKNGHTENRWYIYEDEDH